MATADKLEQVRTAHRIHERASSGKHIRVSLQRGEGRDPGSVVTI
jgi:hypothetical protein